MGVRRTFRASRVAVLFVAVGCHLPDAARPAPVTDGYAAGTLVPLSPRSGVTVARAAAPAVPPVSRAPAVPPPLPGTNAAALLSTTPPAAAKAEAPLPPPDDADSHWVAAGALRTAANGATKLRPPVLIREDEPPIALPKHLPPVTEPPGALPLREAPATPAGGAQPKPVPPGEFLPPIPALPDVPAPMKAPAAPPVALPTHTELPPGVVAPQMTGPIELNGNPVTFDALSKLVDGNICPSCGGSGNGCTTCGGCGPGQCRAGGKRCEPFPAQHTAAGRVIGLIYTSVCCPDPCYQPRWEPLADAAFFTDAVRPKTSTRFRWDYANQFIYPDRGEYFFARADGMGRGPKSNSLVKAIPYVDYHELFLVTEIGMGNAGIQIAMPYRSVNSTPFGPDGAGFSDMTITAKTMLLDTELALFGFQMRTYIPIGQTGKGLGTGHVSLEPGLNFGLRAASSTYLQAQVVQWIPLGGDKDYQGPHLRWGTSINQILWRPVKDVQLVGTFETTGISFQDGLFTDPKLGAQRLAKRTSAHAGGGLRLFFCDTFDLGVGYQHAITGKYLANDFFRFEARYRY